MHSEILSESQFKLLPLLKSFSKEFGLVGGTAVALHLGHRRSIDFDLFTNTELDKNKIRKTIKKGHTIQHVLVENPEEFTLSIDNVKFTFYNFDFPLDFSVNFNDVINIPSVETLAAMKAFALGKRAKWKDYVDLYFVLKLQGLDNIVKAAKDIFAGEFNQKLFREQLAYFNDINYSEAVEFMPGYNVSEDKVKNGLKALSIS